jgi:CheY-like chemotaxis protein
VRTHSVLVVDDDVGFRDLVRRMLIGCGADVVGEAAGVADALRQSVALRPGLALVDIGLPDGDGLALSRDLVAMPWPLRVLLVSADADRADDAVATAAGAVAFVPKHELSAALLCALVERG